MKVLHLMRTYGVHGGEQQLSQLFAANKNEQVEETFAFVLRDPDCATLFAKRAPWLAQVELWPRPQATGSAWCEFFNLIPRLPLLQWRFLRLVADLHSDVCVVHGFQAALVAWPAAFLGQKVKYAYVHRITKGASRIGWLFRLLYWPFSLVAGNSQAVMQSLAPYADERKLVVLDNGIDLEAFDRRRGVASLEALCIPDDEIIISVGRLLPYKGQDILIESVALLLSTRPMLKLWVVGEGISRKHLEDLVRSLGIEQHVFFWGQRSDVPVLLAQARVFVNASSWEGMSNAVLEGMAAGLPSVVANAPGVSECHVSGVTGLVVERDSKSLARGIEQLLAEPACALTMGREARKRIESVYSIAASRQRYDALYARLKEG